MNKPLQQSLFVFSMLLLSLPIFSESPIPFEKLKALQGSWEGIATWTGAKTGQYKMNAVYTLTGRGTVVVEDLVDEGMKVMTSMYHMDGDSLRMTHYCGVGNQPRFRSVGYDPASGKIVFQMVDITNLRAPDAPHVAGAEIILKSENNINIIFDFSSGDQKSREFIELQRIDSSNKK